MRLFAQLPSGRKLTLQAEGDATVAVLKAKIAEQEPTAHSDLMRVTFDKRELCDTQTLAACGVTKDVEFNIGLRPPAKIVELVVGGVKHITTLETLLAHPGSHICRMFEELRYGREPCFPYGGAPGPDGVVEGLPTLAGPLPRREDGAYLIDRNGVIFRYILDALRENGHVALPDKPEQVRQLAIEARYFGLEQLAAVCDAKSAGIVSLATLAAASGNFDAADVAALPDDELTGLLEHHRINILLAKQIRREVGVERERIRLAAEREAARIAALAEAERKLEALRAGLRQLGVQLSEPGLRALVDAGHAHPRSLTAMDAAAAAELGLNEEDSLLVGALVAAGVSDEALTDAPPEVSKTTSNYVAFTRPNELSIDLRAQPVLGAPGESIHETPKAQAEGESGEARAAREAEREPESKPGTAARLNSSLWLPGLMGSFLRYGVQTTVIIYTSRSEIGEHGRRLH